MNQSRASQISRKLVEKLRDEVPQKQFKIAIQAKVGGKILARETIKAMRKDVTAKVIWKKIIRNIMLLAPTFKDSFLSPSYFQISIKFDVRL